VIDAGLLDPLAQEGRALDATGDDALLAAMVETEVAFTGALVDTGLAPAWMTAVCEVLPAPDPVRIAELSRGGGNPVIPLVAQMSAAADAVRAGASDHLHVGATSQDVLDTAAMLVARRVCTEVLGSLTRIGEALAALADAHRATPMVGRTLGQHAAPTTFGLVLAAWLDGVTAALTAVAAVRGGLPLQYGGAVGTGEPLARAAAARGGTADAVLAAAGERLGLRVPAIAWHSNRAPVLALAAALAQAVAAVAVIAVDVTQLARTEVGEVAEERAPGAGGSSAMPHKRNPVTAVLVAATARRAPHLLASLYASAASEDQRPSGAWHAEWLPLRDLQRAALAATGATVGLVRGLHPDTARMAANLELTAGLVYSERAAGALVGSLGRSAAFRLVERASREAVAGGRPLQPVLDDLLAADAHGDAVRAAARSAFDPAAFDPAAFDTASAPSASAPSASDPGAGSAIDRVVSAFAAASLAATLPEES